MASSPSTLEMERDDQETFFSLSLPLNEHTKKWTQTLTKAQLLRRDTYFLFYSQVQWSKPPLAIFIVHHMMMTLLNDI